MKATALEFRFRLWIIVAILTLGFWAPWIEPLGWGSRTTTWLWLGFQLSALHITSTSGIVVVTWLAIAAAAIGAWLRVWGTATLGIGTVHHRKMRAGTVTADGPYRYLRNPLYLGTSFMVAAIAILMPPTGAFFTLVLLSVFQFRLILGEEAFLASSLGQPYQDYRNGVPRLIPALRSRVPGSGLKPCWGQAILAELMPIGTLVCFAALSWQFNSELIERGLLITFGCSLVARALPQRPQP
jgi:protein-S-isoprenylcysteine O-methyltransferase Ste14